MHQGVPKQMTYIHIISRPVICKSLTGGPGLALSVGTLNNLNFDASVAPVSATTNAHMTIPLSQQTRLLGEFKTNRNLLISFYFISTISVQSLSNYSLHSAILCYLYGFIVTETRTLCAIVELWCYVVTVPALIRAVRKVAACAYTSLPVSLRVTIRIIHTEHSKLQIWHSLLSSVSAAKISHTHSGQYPIKTFANLELISCHAII